MAKKSGNVSIPRLSEDPEVRAADAKLQELLQQRDQYRAELDQLRQRDWGGAGDEGLRDAAERLLAGEDVQAARVGDRRRAQDLADHVALLDRAIAIQEERRDALRRERSRKILEALRPAYAEKVADFVRAVSAAAAREHDLVKFREAVEAAGVVGNFQPVRSGVAALADPNSPTWYALREDAIGGGFLTGHETFLVGTPLQR